MNTANHTPGPWRVHTEGDKVGILTGSNTEHLATCYGFRKASNARLVAAAPDLLAALNEMLESSERPHGQQWLSNVRAHAIAAISAATEAHA